MSYTKKRRTSVDKIYDHLYHKITMLELLPGERISEAEIAAQFGVSRQPVRDAFSRLEVVNLLWIRPQRATEVRRFSIRKIVKSRFVRAAVESKVLRQAALACDTKGAAALDASLEKQRVVVAARNHAAFGPLDYAFHATICSIGKADFAFDVISAEKANVDRLCRLSLSKENRLPELLSDHEAIVDMIKRGDAEGADRVGMEHLSHLDATIAAVSESYARYFEP
ncbi:MAG: GntR family transcriptional regulator [Litoreibacter sp.]|uniref:GntR family transcriptional regulator n=1 Tax=Litoreibacter sp. TaxID=1969459 RepID=UPI0032975C9B